MLRGIHNIEENIQISNGVDFLVKLVDLVD